MRVRCVCVCAFRAALFHLHITLDALPGDWVVIATKEANNANDVDSFDGPHLPSAVVLKVLSNAKVGEAAALRWRSRVHWRLFCLASVLPRRASASKLCRC